MRKVGVWTILGAGLLNGVGRLPQTPGTSASFLLLAEIAMSHVLVPIIFTSVPGAMPEPTAPSARTGEPEPELDDLALETKLSTADASAAVMVSYTYSIASSGSKLTITNQLMGTTPTFKATFYTTYGGSGTALRLNACTADKLSLPTKIDDWTIHQLDFQAFADASGTIGYLSTVE